MQHTIPSLTAVAVASVTVGVVTVGVLTLAGCASAPAQESAGIAIVASTSVYGDIADSIVGDLGSVTSIIGESVVDPHSFEASARDQLAIADADLVIANGGGYDPFMDALVEASGTNAVVIDAVTASELLDPAADPNTFNEHVWYSFPGMTHVVEQIATELGTLDPANAPTFDANAAALTAEIDALETRAGELSAQSDGGGAAVTELVPGYLLEAVGLNNLTPSEFTEAIEEGNDVPPLALDDTLTLLTSGSVLLLAYNQQTASPETERVRQAADAAGIPVVLFTETLPEGSHYVSWMSGNLDALAKALQP